VESFNLGAVLFALLLLLWVAYALPRTASRRDVMGRARAAERTEISPAARDLSAVVHSRRPTREASASMSQDRLLLRPADPTSRPRFHTDPGARIDPFEERARSRRLLTVVLSALAVVTIILTVLAVAAAVPWWVAGLSAAGLGIYLVGLRRAELERRARSRTAALARQDQRERESEKRSYARDEAPVRAEITAPLSARSSAPLSRRPPSAPPATSRPRASGPLARCPARPTPCAVRSMTSPPGTPRTGRAWAWPPSRSRSKAPRSSTRSTSTSRPPPICTPTKYWLAAAPEMDTRVQAGRLDRALERAGISQRPVAVLDLDAFDANAADLARRAQGTPIRVASKSLRVRRLIGHV